MVDLSSEMATLAVGLSTAVGPSAGGLGRVRQFVSAERGEGFGVFAPGGCELLLTEDDRQTDLHAEDHNSTIFRISQALVRNTVLG